MKLELQQGKYFVKFIQHLGDDALFLNLQAQCQVTSGSGKIKIKPQITMNLFTSYLKSKHPRYTQSLHHDLKFCNLA